MSPAPLVLGMDIFTEATWARVMEATSPTYMFWWPVLFIHAAIFGLTVRQIDDAVEAHSARLRVEGRGFGEILAGFDAFAAFGGAFHRPAAISSAPYPPMLEVCLTRAFMSSPPAEYARIVAR